MTARLSFAFTVAPGQAESQALMLAQSIRTFGGRLADSPVWVLVVGPADRISADARRQLSESRAQLVSFGIEPDAQSFPFGAKAYAAAAAEGLVSGHTDLLVWMDSDSIIIQEPGALVLDPGSALGYRPVDHTLIGSPYDAPPDPFWETIYRECGVAQERLFPMLTSVDRDRIRPYFNAGMLVVRPARGFLRAWRANFQRLFPGPAFDQFYDADDLYRFFVHQAVLAGTILAHADSRELQELPHLVNYPLHMHAQYPADRRPASLNETITCRYDVFFEDEQWERAIAIHEPLSSWLEDLMAERGADDRPRPQPGAGPFSLSRPTSPGPGLPASPAGRRPGDSVALNTDGMD